jgi:NCAIR mutase (PurE)-related protein
MDPRRLVQLLEDVKVGKMTVESALVELRRLPYEDLGFAQIDHHRALRTGFPEVVFGLHKSPEQVAAIAKEILSRSDRLLVTRVGLETYKRVQMVVPDVTFDKMSQTLIVDRRPSTVAKPGVLVISAGTADLPVAEEAAVTAELMDSAVERLYDVGIAGVHRLLERLSLLQEAKVIVVVAGMEGALPSLVGGLVSAPVLAVPTSVGYGSSFDGLAALLTMMNGCAPGVAVVNIDNGFGAGYLAGVINGLPINAIE